MEKTYTLPHHIAARRAAIQIQKLMHSADVVDFRNVKSDSDSAFYPFYVATNENLAYLADLDIDGKDTLTVTGSGDQAINLAFFGAKTVETFDINSLTAIAFNLKKTALLHLTRSEFIDFYSMPDIFKKKLYFKISPFLKETTRAVFDAIVADPYYGINCVAERSIIRQNLLTNNPYLQSEATYKEAQRRIAELKKPIFARTCSINKLGGFFSPKDVVILSNVLNYCLHGDYNNDDYNFSSQEKISSFVKNLSDVLKEGGVVSLLYMYSHKSPAMKLLENLKIKTHYVSIGEKSPAFMSKNHYVALASKEDFPELE